MLDQAWVDWLTQAKFFTNRDHLFNFEERPSESAFVEAFWSTHGDRAGGFISLATCNWEMVVCRYHGETFLTVRGPETKATPVLFSMVGAEFFGIRFKVGTWMPNLPAGHLVDGSVDLPGAGRGSFWLNSATWQSPDFQNADTFVGHLVHEGLLVRDNIVNEVIQDHPQALTQRSIRRRFLRSIGLTPGVVRRIERACIAFSLLKQGVSILDTVDQAGYADQPHLTRSLKYFMGKTPAQVLHELPS